MKSVHLTILATAIGVALAGAGMSDTQAANNPSLTASAPVQVTDAENPSGRYFITFVEQGLALYDGGVAGLSRTAAHVDGVSANSSRKFEINSSASRAYRSYLAQQRAQHLTAVENAIGRMLDIRFTFDITRNAVSAKLSPAEVARIAAVPGVKSVTPVGVQHADTFRGPKFIGADKIWDGSAVPSYSSASRGQGIKVGIIDTGTNSAHPSFANDPACGFSDNNPKLINRDCTSDTNGVCDGPDGNADTSSHGVHTGSTAAGNTIDNTANPAPLLPDGVTMSGVAPCAKVYSYRVADHTDGALYGDYLEAAFSNAVIDQVDVANYSIGPTCGGGNPWDNLAFLVAEASDIFIAASAGNTRSTCTNPTGLVGNNGPWLMTVAASTQDQFLSPQLTVTGPTPVNPLLVGIPMNPGSTTLAPVDTSNFTGHAMRTYAANIEACTSSGGIPAGTFGANEVAIVRRGSCNFSEKVTNAYNAGARFVVVANNQAGTINMNTTGAPTDAASFSISQAAGDVLIALVNANEPPVSNPDVIFANGFDPVGFGTADYQRSAIGSQAGDVLAGFSFRGPTQAPYDNLTKPDITGPGVNIYAAESAADGSYGLMSGTSMSSPHLAGSGALIRAVHPSWSPMEVKSALMTTAKLDGMEQDGVTPWTVDDVGSGRVDLTKAALAGLTMDETVDRFMAANPSGGSINQKELNLPSMRDSACGTSCSWTRTFRNRLNAQGTWTLTAVDPPGYHLTFSQPSITLYPGFSGSVTITATATGAPTTSHSYGRIDLTESSSLSPVQHLSVAVRGAAPPPSDSVICTNHNCTFKVDQLVSSISGLGCASWCGMIWVNRYTPNAADFPITITNVQTIFGASAGWNAAGDKVSIFIYNDNDADPTNGATAVGTPTIYTIGTPANAFVDIPLTTPVVVNGPEVLIALSNPNASNVGARPATLDAGPFMNRSYIGDAVGDGTTAPSLSDPAMALALNTTAIPTLSKNYVVRATGTTANGRPIVLTNAPLGPVSQ